MLHLRMLFQNTLSERKKLEMPVVAPVSHKPGRTPAAPRQSYQKVACFAAAPHASLPARSLCRCATATPMLAGSAPCLARVRLSQLNWARVHRAGGVSTGPPSCVCVCVVGTWRALGGGQAQWPFQQTRIERYIPSCRMHVPLPGSCTMRNPLGMPIILFLAGGAPEV